MERYAISCFNLMRRVFMNTKPREDDTAAVLDLIPRVANFVLILSETSLDNHLCLEEVKVGRPCQSYCFLVFIVLFRTVGNRATMRCLPAAASLLKWA